LGPWKSALTAATTVRASYAYTARLALLLLKSSPVTPNAILLVIDDDGDVTRRTGLQQARENVPGVPTTAIGVAHSRRECWVLAGFEPQKEDETDRLNDTIKELTFDPRTDAHRLNDKHPHQPRSAKRVLAALVQDDWDREAQCWQSTSIGILEARGKSIGLTDFLSEIRTRFVPLFCSNHPE
jgi:hypothetical protein